MIQVPEGETRYKNTKKTYQRNNDWKLVYLGERDIQIQVAQEVLKRMNLKRSTLRNITMKLPKIKDKKRIFKTARNK